MTVRDDEIEKIIYTDYDNIKCKKFCIFPDQIAMDIELAASGDNEYGYIVIGVEKKGTLVQIWGINPTINFGNIFKNALQQLKVTTDVEHKICKVGGKTVWAIKVKTCETIIETNEKQNILKDKILNDFIIACVKLQANSVYYSATEDQRNDYLRDLLETSGYDVKDQTRRGLSPTGKAAGEVDILIKENGLPIAVIEALNLGSLDKAYLDKHIDKIYGYDTAGNSFNVVLSYVTLANFSEFCSKYIEHIETHTYPYPLIAIEDNIVIGDNTYADIKIMKTSHNRNGKRTDLFHICALIG